MHVGPLKAFKTTLNIDIASFMKVQSVLKRKYLIETVISVTQTFKDKLCMTKIMVNISFGRTKVNRTYGT